jgi:hypothetical protein
MKDLSPRFCIPINMPRPRGARLIEGFSPKLGRRLQLFDHAAFSVWIGLEADPKVLSLCERPARLGLTNTDPVIDFWVQQSGGEEFHLVPQSEQDNSLPTNLGGTPIRTITAVDRAAAGVWTSNWARMLPVINVARNSITKATMKSVSRFVREPLSLAFIERQFGNGDPTVIRATLFEMLRTGQLAAPALRTQPLSLNTSLEPMP